MDAHHEQPAAASEPPVHRRRAVQVLMLAALTLGCVAGNAMASYPT